MIPFHRFNLTAVTIIATLPLGLCILCFFDLSRRTLLSRYGAGSVSDPFQPSAHAYPPNNALSALPAVPAAQSATILKGAGANVPVSDLRQMVRELSTRKSWSRDNL